MRINHNIAALNAWRGLKATDGALNKSLEKLSSGLRINRAADDAAGLAISEKMRAQIKGLDQAMRNAQDGISLIQTAEGALNETHSILQRMRELAVQSANDTNTASDRAEIQKEIDQLAQELSRIGNTTEFNTQNLLDGTFAGTFHIGANEGQNLAIDISDMRAQNLGVAGNFTTTIASSISLSPGTTPDADDGTYTVALEGNTYQLLDSSGNVVAESSDGLTFTGVGVDGGSGFGDDAFTLTDTAKVGGSVVISSGAVTSFDAEITNSYLQPGTYTATTTELTDANGNVIATSTDATTFTDTDGNTVLQFGAAITADTVLTVGGINIASQSDANSAITAIDNALELVSNERSKLGAYQNRLEHTINNLGVAMENLTAAESRVRDVDMAAEMMNFTKQQILSQAGTAMLAQANARPQSILQLLG